MTYLCSLYGEENVCQISCKNSLGRATKKSILNRVKYRYRVCPMFELSCIFHIDQFIDLLVHFYYNFNRANYPFNHSKIPKFVFYLIGQIKSDKVLVTWSLTNNLGHFWNLKRDVRCFLVFLLLYCQFSIAQLLIIFFLLFIYETLGIVYEKLEWSQTGDPPYSMILRNFFSWLKHFYIFA